MTTPLLKRLEQARRRSFVGRERERELFLAALRAPELPFFVLFVHGPGGVGKTTLVRTYATLAAEADAGSTYLDGRALDPTPDVFLLALGQALGLERGADVPAGLAASGRRHVVFLDTYELLRPLDAWLRETFLPRLPDNAIFVLSGRQPPATAWREDPGWQALMRIVSLRNLSGAESRAYLDRREIPPEVHDGLLAFTHGHPLALSLVADVLNQQPEATLAPQASPDIIKMLVERLIDEAPGPLYRAALEACAQVRLTTEPLLAALLATPDVRDIFDWLRSLSFMDAEIGGLFPHDLARDALVADLRWRNPDWYVQLHERARGYYMETLPRLDSRQQRRLLSDFVFLHRENSLVRPYFQWQSTGVVFTDRLGPGDDEAIVGMVRAFEGEASAGIARHWMARQPMGVAVLRGAANQVEGALIRVAVETTTAAERALDPMLQAVWSFLQRQSPLREGETATLFRFWLTREGYQAVSPAQSRLFLNMVQHYLITPGLAFTFLPCAEPDFWAPAFGYADLTRAPALDTTVDGRRYGLYLREWRVSGPLTWLALLGERELATEIAPPPREVPQTRILDEESFAAAVRDALRSLNDPLVLRGNPLLHARWLSTQGDGQGRADGPARAAGLREAILAAIADLQGTPRQRKLHRALYHTYVQPAPTQEGAAELLDLPFSTFRRHLRQGVDAVVARLWEREIGHDETLG